MMMICVLGLNVWFTTVGSAPRQAYRQHCHPLQGDRVDSNNLPAQYSEENRCPSFAQQNAEIGYACLPRITVRLQSKKIRHRDVILAATVAREMYGTEDTTIHRLC